MPDRRSAAELASRGLLLAYLCWLPLPFGSVTERAQLPLVIGALVICAMAAFARAAAIVTPSVSEGPGGTGGAAPSRPGPSLTLGVTALVVVAAIVAFVLFRPQPTPP